MYLKILGEMKDSYCDYKTCEFLILFERNFQVVLEDLVLGIIKNDPLRGSH